MYVRVYLNRDAFVVLACDGIWDVMSNQQVVDFLGARLGFTGRIGS
jgi:serine/threonine protein phosphatase PrpC